MNNVQNKTADCSTELKFSSIHKIAIIGNAGSGKSTLGFELHKKLNIPLYHLDQYYWNPGWQRVDADEFAQIHKSLCDKEEWIIDVVGLLRLFEQHGIEVFVDGGWGVDALFKSLSLMEKSMIHGNQKKRKL